MNTMPIYQIIARRLEALQRCYAGLCDSGFAQNHRFKIADLVEEYFPRGSGFDNGTSLDLDDSTPDKLVFKTSFHHMNEQGVYDGWTEHRVIVRPSLAHGVSISVGGRDRNDIKTVIGDMFLEALMTQGDY